MMNNPLLFVQIIANRFTDVLEVTANLVTIVGFFAIALSFIAFYYDIKKQRQEENERSIKEKIIKLEQKIHIIDAIKSQLQVIGHWRPSRMTNGWRMVLGLHLPRGGAF